MVIILEEQGHFIRPQENSKIIKTRRLHRSNEDIRVLRGFPAISRASLNSGQRMRASNGLAGSVDEPTVK